jgi:tetratricopeptide (TPR) repeat protein
MYAQKLELLEAKIRETAILVTRLREEKQRLQQESTRLRERLAELEEELQHVYTDDASPGPNLEHLLRQLDSLQQDDDEIQPRPAAQQEVQNSVKAETPDTNDPFRIGIFYEQQGRLAEAASVYQHILDADPDNLEATQRLATLLEKLNRNTEAARLWNKIWKMHQARTTTKRRWLR